MKTLIFLLFAISGFAQDFQAPTFADAGEKDPVTINWPAVRRQTYKQVQMMAGVCDCDITIPANVWYVDKDTKGYAKASVYDIKPGMTVCFADGQRGPIEFHNVNGTAAEPITFISCGGTTIKGTGGQRDVQFYNSSFIKFMGNVGPIDITGGGHGIYFRDLSTDVETAFINFHDIGYSGFEAKTDPSCDPKTWRGAFVLRNVKVHDCTFKNMNTGEAIYIGESHYDGVGAIQGGPCFTGVKTAQEHEVIGVWVYNNNFENIGHDAIQVGACTSGGYIYNNKIYNFGMTNEFGQMSGIQINPGTNAEVYNNWIEKGPGYGIFGGGRGGSKIHHNLIIGTGKTTDGGGILLAKYQPFDDAGFQVYNNTLLDIKRIGVEVYPETGNNNLYDNIINVSSGLLVKLNGPNTKLLDKGNVKVVGASSLVKLDPNYVPLPTSPAYREVVDAGAFQSKKVFRSEWRPDGVVDSIGRRFIFIRTPQGRIELKQ